MHLPDCVWDAFLHIYIATLYCKTRRRRKRQESCKENDHYLALCYNDMTAELDSKRNEKLDEEDGQLGPHSGT